VSAGAYGRPRGRAILSVLLPALLQVTACSRDRERPNPTDPETTAQLSVEVLEPRQNATVVAGRNLSVRVNARDLRGSNLAGVGFVVRRAFVPGTPTLDSAAVRFATTADRTEEFTFVVPADLPTNAQLDVTGIAIGPGAQARLSQPRSVVVARCEPPQTGCS
jgi:hypothetical protein